MLLKAPAYHSPRVAESCLAIVATPLGATQRLREVNSLAKFDVASGGGNVGCGRQAKPLISLVLPLPLPLKREDGFQPVVSCLTAIDRQWSTHDQKRTTQPRLCRQPHRASAPRRGTVGGPQPVGKIDWTTRPPTRSLANPAGGLGRRGKEQPRRQQPNPDAGRSHPAS